jgi:hypothetical protein
MHRRGFVLERGARKYYKRARSRGGTQRHEAPSRAPRRFFGSREWRTPFPRSEDFVRPVSNPHEHLRGIGDKVEAIAKLSKSQLDQIATRSRLAIEGERR